MTASFPSVRRGRRALAALAGTCAGPVLVSALQVWSHSLATPVEYLGRIALVALFAVLHLRGAAWPRWLLAVICAGAAIFLIRMSWTSPMLGGMRGVVVTSIAVASALCGLALLLARDNARPSAEPRPA